MKTTNSNVGHPTISKDDYLTHEEAMNSESTSTNCPDGSHMARTHIPPPTIATRKITIKQQHNNTTMRNMQARNSNEKAAHPVSQSERIKDPNPVSPAKPQGGSPQPAIPRPQPPTGGGSYPQSRMQILAGHSYLKDLENANPNPKHSLWPREYLEPLYPPGSLIFAGTVDAIFKTALLDEFGDELSSQSYVDPNPRTTRSGFTVGDPKRGIPPRPISRCKQNTGQTRHVGYRGTFDDQEDEARAIISLARQAHLSMVVEGDRDHLEAWFYVGDWPLQKIKKFQEQVTKFGSERASRICCQPFAIPLGINWAGPVSDRALLTKYPWLYLERYKVLYFDPPAFKSVAG